MGLLQKERVTLNSLLPGLDARLAEFSLTELERPGNPGIELLRKAGGAALLVPAVQGGKGATALQAVRVLRAIGSRSPSLAVATTMHSFSVATLVEFGVFDPNDDGGSTVLRAVTDNHWLIASGFAEGRPGTSILAATMAARATPGGGYVISGSKKPCSLAYSMHLLSASVTLQDDDGSTRRAIALIPADAAGIERRPFWRSGVLTGAESDEVILHDVAIPGHLLFFPTVADQLDPVETAGFLWFQLLVSASYLGAASGLVERVVLANKGSDVDRTLLGIEVESAMEALENIAQAMESEPKQELLARALLVRFAIQSAIERACALAAELLGGMAFISSPDVSYLLGASRALAFHPPSRLSSSTALAGHLKGGVLQWL